MDQALGRLFKRERDEGRPDEEIDPKNTRFGYRRDRVGQNLGELAARGRRSGRHIRDLTCAPNVLMRRIHDRMPLILGEGSMTLWLDPAVDAVEELEALLRPYDPNEIAADPMSS